MNADTHDIHFVEVDDLLNSQQARSDLVGQTVRLTFRDKRPPSQVEGLVSQTHEDGAVVIGGVWYDLRSITQVAVYKTRHVPFYRNERLKGVLSTLYDNYPLVIGVVVFVTASVWLCHLAVESEQYEQRLMRECMTDGNKEYVCRSMLRTKSDIPVPMYMPR